MVTFCDLFEHIEDILTWQKKPTITDLLTPIATLTVSIRGGTSYHLQLSVM